MRNIEHQIRLTSGLNEFINELFYDLRSKVQWETRDLVSTILYNNNGTIEVAYSIIDNLKK